MEEYVNKLAMWQAKRKTIECDLNDDPEVAGCNETIAALEAQITEAHKTLVFMCAGYDTRISEIDDEIKHVSAQIIDAWDGEKKTIETDAGTIKFRTTYSLKISDEAALLANLLDHFSTNKIVEKYLKGFYSTPIKEFMVVHELPTDVAGLVPKTTVKLEAVSV